MYPVLVSQHEVHSNHLNVASIDLMQIFTDAGQYVIRFGSTHPSSNTGLASAVKYRFID